MSRARLFRSIKALDADAVAELLAAQPELARATDDRRRNPLHFLCSLPASPKTSDRSIRLARQLLAAGIGIDAPAFVEGAFQATPLWYAISRGRNGPLARFLLKQGSSPEYCLWAAAFKDDVETIDLLVRHGASIDPVTEDETPFLSAIKWSHFAAAERLLHHGANVNFPGLEGRDRPAPGAQEGQRSGARRHADAPRRRPDDQEQGRQEPARPRGPAEGQDLPDDPLPPPVSATR
jgi:ankyrin repeat protein